MAHPLDYNHGHSPYARPMSDDDTGGFDIKLRLFIPAPAAGTPGEDWGIRDYLPDALNAYFGGDDRGFSYSQGTSRAEIHARAIFRTDKSGSFSNGEYLRYVKTPKWGTSHQYQQDDVVSVPGKPFWWFDVKDGATPSKSDTLKRTTGNLGISEGGSSASEQYAGAVLGHDIQAWTLKVAGALPLIPSPDINCDLTLMIMYKGAAEGFSYKVIGDHDGFPAYELYLEGNLIYSHDPVAEDQTPASLIAPSEYNVDTGWKPVPSTKTDLISEGQGYRPAHGAPHYARPLVAGEVKPIIDAKTPWGAIGQIYDFFKRKKAFTAGVPDTSYFPFSAICQIKTQFPAHSGTGTGFYIAPDLILTAAHNVDHKVGGIADKITLRPGRNGSSTLAKFDVMPVDWTVHPTYTAAGTRYDEAHDLAIIRVPNNPPPNGFHFNLINYSPSADTPIAVCGYASGGQDPDVQNMDFDIIRKVEGSGAFVDFNLQARHGTSGGPVFVDFANDMSGDHPPDGIPVMGVLTTTAGAKHNRGVLMTPDKINWAMGGGNSSVNVFSLGNHSIGGLPVMGTPRGVVGGLPVSMPMSASPSRSLMHGMGSVGGLPVRPQGLAGAFGRSLSPAMARGQHARQFDAAGVASLAYSVISGAFTPGDPKIRYSIFKQSSYYPADGKWSGKAPAKSGFRTAEPFRIRHFCENLAGQDIGAEFEVMFEYNGKYLFDLELRPTAVYSQDAYLWSLNVESYPRGDAKFYSLGGNNEISRAEFSVIFTFSRSAFSGLIRPDDIRREYLVQVFSNGFWRWRLRKGAGWRALRDAFDEVARHEESADPNQPQPTTQSWRSRSLSENPDEAILVSETESSGEWQTAPQLIAMAPTGIDSEIDGMPGDGPDTMIASYRPRTMSRRRFARPLQSSRPVKHISAIDLKVGDIIATTTEEWLSRKIRKSTNSPVSHTAMYIGDGEVIESIAGGVTQRRLTVALSEYSAAIVYRMKGLTQAERTAIRDFAVGKKDQKFDIVRLIAHGSPWLIEKGVGADNDSYYCTELIFDAYASAGKPIANKPADSATPVDIIRSGTGTTATLDYIGDLVVLKGSDDLRTSLYSHPGSYHPFHHTGQWDDARMATEESAGDWKSHTLEEMKFTHLTGPQEADIAFRVVWEANGTVIRNVQFEAIRTDGPGANKMQIISVVRGLGPDVSADAPPARMEVALAVSFDRLYDPRLFTYVIDAEGHATGEKEVLD